LTIDPRLLATRPLMKPITSSYLNSFQQWPIAPSDPSHPHSPYAHFQLACSSALLPLLNFYFKNSNPFYPSFTDNDNIMKIYIFRNAMHLYNPGFSEAKILFLSYLTSVQMKSDAITADTNCEHEKTKML
jgi:hypothetical protein